MAASFKKQALHLSLKHPKFQPKPKKAVSLHTWIFPRIGWFPQNGWFTTENPIKMDDLGGFPIIFGNAHMDDERASIFSGPQAINNMTPPPSPDIPPVEHLPMAL